MKLKCFRLYVTNIKYDRFLSDFIGLKKNLEEKYCQKSHSSHWKIAEIESRFGTTFIQVPEDTIVTDFVDSLQETFPLAGLRVEPVNGTPLHQLQ